MENSGINSETGHIDKGILVIVFDVALVLFFVFAYFHFVDTGNAMDIISSPTNEQNGYGSGYSFTQV